MSSILEAEDVLFSVVSGRNFMEAKTKKKRQARQLAFNLVTASDFVSKLKHAVALLKLVAKPMKLFEKNETPVSDVFKLFLDLPTSIETCGLPARDVKVVKGLVRERFDFIYVDAHGVGFLLVPRYRGLGMDSTTRGNVETLLVQWHDGDEAANEVVIELVRFHRFASEMSIKSPRVWEMLSRGKLSIYDYWCSLSQFPLLQSIAKRVFRCTPSSSASERNFSTHGFIHSRLRNRLEPDRVEKLVHVYFNARNIQDADMEMYSDLDDLLRLIDNDDEDDNTRDNRDADFVYE